MLGKVRHATSPLILEPQFDGFTSYFNTVGSREGWTPSSFVSSRSARRSSTSRPSAQRPEDFMDDEDMADTAASQSLRTHQSYAALGGPAGHIGRYSNPVGFSKTEDEPIGRRLLRIMGWGDDHQTGFAVRSTTSATTGSSYLGQSQSPSKLGLPFGDRRRRKYDRKGLAPDGDWLHNGNKGEPQGPRPATATASGHSHARCGSGATGSGLRSKPISSNPQISFGSSAAHDDDFDEENPYELGPRISCKKTVDQSKRKHVRNGKDSNPNTPANPLIDSRPVFRSKKAMPTKSSLLRCHDGRCALDGFVLRNDSNATSILEDFQRYHAPVKVPQGWQSPKVHDYYKSSTSTNEQNSIEPDERVTLDAKSRGPNLEEPRLPGKSVFQYMSHAARERLATLTGKSGLSPNLDNSSSDRDNESELLSNVPQPTVDKEQALSALDRGARGWTPYADDGLKRSRYQAFLEFHGALRDRLPDRPAAMNQRDWRQELQEFVEATANFKPMKGLMASRFTTSSLADSASSSAAPNHSGPQSLTFTDSTKYEDTHQAAAKLGMYGLMTRSSRMFQPTPLLCKRFNVKAPTRIEEVEPDATADGRLKTQVNNSTMQARTDFGVGSSNGTTSTKARLDPSINEALEKRRANAAVLRSVFSEGDDKQG